jgi:hypothetical protein
MVDSIHLFGVGSRGSGDGWWDVATPEEHSADEKRSWMVSSYDDLYISILELILTPTHRIESLIEEAYNERMHLLTFMKLAEPGPFMRLMVLGAQGVFFNLFFLSYLISPRTCHRFVGYLEEEAVITYTHAIHDVEAGKLPLWNNLAAPDIAVKYWEMPEGKRRMVDLLLYVRADEAKHREVNHTLGNLDQKKDPNPYTAEYHDPSQPRPIDGPDPNRAYGWERKDVI